MWRRSLPLFLALPAFFVPAAPGSAIILDPQPGFDEYNAEAAVHPNGDVLLVWTRNEPNVPVVTAMAATLDPDTGHLGELHEWGAGSVDRVVPLGPGYLALRVDGQLFAQFLDEGGQPVGEALPLGPSHFPTEAHSTPDGGAIVITILSPGTAAESVVNAWRFGPDGILFSGPTELARNGIQAALDMDAAGNLVLAWRIFGNAVFARRFSPDLQPLSRILPVASGHAYAVRVAVAPDGGFVVIYSKRAALWAQAFHANASSAGAVPTIQARVLSLAGVPLTRIFRLARSRPFVSGLQQPRVERLPEGDFLVLWTGSGENGSTMRFRRVSGR